ncbi:hypothetical protein LJ656_21620 [Paraburkholderia sp. MMS20-SJTR3]|uniref:Uncharacterized protein n=1 Tax=Paraburkholderia sejongensis TaxID=2886946 RepID=A0ABS8JZ64_9BURK|nr:hypothetical protein [Paraburkholderia sp. MMS20-SJTR3]MCC8395191.1 hypothetical protein [Paraburkholderia sp. MMS20-SJTR3]
MKIDLPIKLVAALVCGCCAFGFAPGAHAQTGSSPATQGGQAGAKGGASLEESRTPDSTGANNANGAIGEGSGATNGVAGGGNGRTTKQQATPSHKRMKGASSAPAGGAGQ